MLSMKDPRTLQAITEALLNHDFVNLKEINAKRFLEYPQGTVFIDEDREGRIKTILIKDNLFDWVLNLEITSPGRTLCEMWDLERFRPTGFAGRLIYRNRIKAGTVAGGHYHKKKKELFFVASKKGSLIFHLIRLADNEKIEIEMGSSPVQILDMNYSPAIRINPGINHAVENPGKQGSVLLVVVANRSHDSKDDYNMND
ncbi:MAG: hypothetical protein PHI66_02140 [Candidatus Pacebacteria bacterium]|nr:hypothetical protein [Candidatus Paceibacterota bacterium]